MHITNFVLIDNITLHFEKTLGNYLLYIFYQFDQIPRLYIHLNFRLQLIFL